MIEKLDDPIWIGFIKFSYSFFLLAESAIYWTWNPISAGNPISKFEPLKVSEKCSRY